MFWPGLEPRISKHLMLHQWKNFVVSITTCLRHSAKGSKALAERNLWVMIQHYLPQHWSEMAALFKRWCKTGICRLWGHFWHRVLAFDDQPRPVLEAPCQQNPDIRGNSDFLSKQRSIKHTKCVSLILTSNFQWGFSCQCCRSGPGMLRVGNWARVTVWELQITAR